MANIERLLEKYWEGESSLEEEAQLMHYFHSGNIAPHLLVHASLFRGLNKAKNSSIPEASEQRIYQQLQPRPVSKPLWPQVAGNWLKVAACIALAVIGSYWLVPSSPALITTSEVLEQETFEDPQQAYEEVRKTLMMLSKGLNEGTAEVGNVSDLNKGTSLFLNPSSKHKQQKP